MQELPKGTPTKAFREQAVKWAGTETVFGTGGHEFRSAATFRRWPVEENSARSYS
jgi:hypothetical protein